MPFIPDAKPAGRFVPDAPVASAAPAVSPVEPADIRTSENIGGFIGEKLSDVLHTRKAGPDVRDEQFGKAIGLSVDEMAQSIRQYVPGMGHDAAVKAASDIKERMEKIPAAQKYAGEIAAMGLPFGAIGKLATGAKAVSEMSKVEKVVQALKTVGAGGAATAALTPVTEKGDFAQKKATQFGEGAAGTALLGGSSSAVKGIVGKLVKAYKSGDSEAAALIQKAIQAAGFSPKTLRDVSQKSEKVVQRAQEVPGIAAAGRSGSNTPEEIGSKIRDPIVQKQDNLLKERAKQTEPIKQRALENETPIETNDVTDFLAEQSSKETASGQALYKRVINDLSTEGTSKIQSHQLENARNEIKSLIQNGIDGQPIGQTRAANLDKALKLLDQKASEAIPEWGQYFQKYKELSQPMDAFRRQEGSEIGKLTKIDSLTGAHEIPPEKVPDHILSGGVTRVRAALKASGDDPAVRKSLGDALWLQVNSKAQNQKMTPAAMDTFIQKNGDVIKELGLTDRFEMQRGVVKAGDAIGKTAIGKLAGAKGNAVDSFETLGKILDAPSGRREGLSELVKLTKNDPEAREALKYAVVMHGVTQSPGTAALTRQAVLPDLEASGLFSRSDMENVSRVNQVFDQAMKVGSSDKTTAGSIVGSILSHTPGLKTVGIAVKGLQDTGEQASMEKTRNLLMMAAVDPKVAKTLLSAPTEHTIKEGLNAMERASIFMAVREGVDQ